MPRRARAVAFGWIVLTAVSGAVRGEEPPAGEQGCKPYGAGWTICSRLDLEELRTKGATIWHVWLPEIRKPSLIRLHNSSPEVVRLKGGKDDLTFHTGCKRHGRFRVKVYAVGPGEPRLTARPQEESPKKEASKIAAEIAPLLRALEARFREARSRLPVLGTGPSGAPVHDPKAVADLLDETEKSLLAILSYKELAALRDSVRYEFEKARSALREESAQAWRAPERVPHDRIALAAFHTSQMQILPAKAQSSSKASSWDRIIERLLGRTTEVAEEDDLLIDICATSSPESGWKFTIYPASNPGGKRETETNNIMPNIVRGLHAYKAEKGLHRITCKLSQRDDLDSCALLDLLNWKDEVIACSPTNDFCYLRPDPNPPPSCRSSRGASGASK